MHGESSVFPRSARLVASRSPSPLLERNFLSLDQPRFSPRRLHRMGHEGTEPAPSSACTGSTRNGRDFDALAQALEQDAARGRAPTSSAAATATGSPTSSSTRRDLLRRHDRRSWRAWAPTTFDWVGTRWAASIGMFLRSAAELPDPAPRHQRRGCVRAEGTLPQRMHDVVARAAIVTLPLGVLQLPPQAPNGVRFVPALTSKQKASRSRHRR